MRFGFIDKLIRFAFAAEGSVKTRVVRSGLWVGVESIIGSVLQLGRSIVLARLLSPDVFGLMGLASVALRAVETVTRPGVAQAMIARQREFEDAAPTAFTLLAVRGLLLALLMAAVAPLISHFYASAELESVIRALSVVFVIGGLKNIQAIAREKELDFRLVAYLGLSSNVLGTVVTIGLAFWYRNVWALVIGQLVTTAIGTLLSYALIPGRPRMAWDATVARELFAYGKFITGSSILLFIATEVDSAVIGKLLGLEQLGFYALALTIANLVTTNLAKLASSIMMPAYSKLQGETAALRIAFLRTLSLVALVVLPAAVGIALLAEPLLSVVFGEKWLPGADALRILSMFGLFRAFAAFNGYLFEGIGQPRVAYWLALLRLVVIAPLIVPMTLRFGLAGAATTVTIGIASQWIGGLRFLSTRLGISFREITSACWRACWTSALMAVAAFALIQVFPKHSLGALSITVVGAIAIYVGLNVSLLRSLTRGRTS